MADFISLKGRRFGRWKVVKRAHYAVFVRMLREQHGRCAICNRRMTKPNVDHCHRTNKVRQLLCSFCNRLLGDAKENTAILKAAINYLRRHQ